MSQEEEERCSFYRPDRKSSLSIPAQEDVIEGFRGNVYKFYEYLACADSTSHFFCKTLSRASWLDSRTHPEALASV